ncbi:2-amino-3-ketobutyrate CoA ligase [Intrasporangium oryzae NRRL B-24470]|uniref:2-amino-3-ketobutyrate coenzyme A ligase n=1 Tax=Intrasporangium oryzae NRRL B-24470 TaxID=1386089 RepID=W9G8E4_9MICO|nr:glycine C-acetyltransferase [Intrasporangium oryzae]EWT02325.1 2-amino-3-ketobutyrate CoA ligase [Intrasporangium oryzae NRRL B-24470]
MYGSVKDELAATLQEIKDAGLYKNERELTSPQAAHITTLKAEALNFCANNYLGLADDPTVIEVSKRALDEWGFGMASVRFICGTQTLHTELEHAISDFLGTEATILYSSCFDANGGVFEVLFGPDDAIISDELNHASIIDGIRLSKAQRFRYRNADMDDLRTQLEAARAAGAKRIVVVTDGVFSMDGSYAPLDRICGLADEFGALVFVDDSHAVGFVGDGGRGTPELFGVSDRVDIVTGTLGKALGGASGGYVSSHQEVVDLLRQRSRPYLFSNSVAPAVVAGSMAALRLVEGSADKRDALKRNTALFQELMTEAGFELLPGMHPIRPVMFPGEDGARRATQIADHMLGNGVYVIAFSYPVVPKGRARIRVQLSAAHSEDDVRACVDAFVKARDAVG